MTKPNNTHAADYATLGNMTFYTVTTANTVDLGNVAQDADKRTQYDRLVSIINGKAQPVVLFKADDNVVKFGADHDLDAEQFELVINGVAEFANSTVDKGL